MSKSINRIHPNNLIKPYGDDYVYQYDGKNWVRVKKTIHKIYHKSITEIDPHDYLETDLLVLHKHFDNIIKFSEDYNKVDESLITTNYPPELKTYWYKDNVQFNDRYTFDISETKYPLTELDLLSSTTDNSPMSHGLSQRFNTEIEKTYLFSCFCASVNETANNHIALSLYNPTYNVGFIVKFNIINGTIEDAYLTDNNYNHNPELEEKYRGLVNNFGYTISPLQIKDTTYYRCSINGNFNVSSECVGEFLILDDESNVKYPVSIEDVKKSGVYLGGFQLEEHDISPLIPVTSPYEPLNIRPSIYLTTYQRPLLLKIFDKIYIKKNDSEFEETPYKIFYFDDGKEELQIELDKYFFKPIGATNNTPNKGDIGVIKSVLALDNPQRLLIKDKNTAHLLQRYSQNTAGELLKDGVVVLGKKSNIEDDEVLPKNTIYYDTSIQKYRLNIGEEYSNKFVTFKTKSPKFYKRAMHLAFLYNQCQFATWSASFNEDYSYGFNIGGCYNFLRLSRY